MSTTKDALRTVLQKTLHDFIVKVTGASTRREEAELVQAEAQQLKKNLESYSQFQELLTTAKRSDMIKSCLICAMLGHPLAFALREAVSLIQQPRNSQDKALGYLLCRTVLHRTHPSSLMLVNAMKTDIEGVEPLYSMMALLCASNICTDDMSGPLVACTQKLVIASKPTELRCSAYRALDALCQREQDRRELLWPIFRRSLSEPDIEIMSNCLRFFSAESRRRTSATMMTKLLPTFCHILTQVVQGHVPPSLSYHGCDAPWMQIELLSVIRRVLWMSTTALSSSTLSQLYVCVAAVMDAASDKVDAGFAVMLEAVRTACALHAKSAPFPELRDARADLTSRLNLIGSFLTSSNNNLRYTGLRMASFAIGPCLDVVQRYQLEIVAFLEDKLDPLLQCQALDVLFQMVSEKNVKLVLDSVFSILESMSSSKYMRANVLSICNNACLVIAKWCDGPELVENFVRLLAVLKISNEVASMLDADKVHALSVRLSHMRPELHLLFGPVHAKTCLVNIQHIPAGLCSFVIAEVGQYCNESVPLLVNAYRNGDKTVQDAAVAAIGQALKRLPSVDRKEFITLLEREIKYAPHFIELMHYVHYDKVTDEALSMEQFMSQVDHYANSKKSSGKWDETRYAELSRLLTATKDDFSPGSKPIRFTAYENTVTIPSKTQLPTMQNHSRETDSPTSGKNSRNNVVPLMDRLVVRSSKSAWSSAGYAQLANEDEDNVSTPPAQVATKPPTPTAADAEHERRRRLAAALFSGQ